MKSQLIAALCFLAALPLVAESQSATMNVSATVIARAIVTIDQRPDEIVITADDLQRGYVDLGSQLHLLVRTNARRGYVLRVAITNPAFSTALLTAENLSMQVSPESVIARPYRPGIDSLAMNVRLMLAPDAQAGHYPFPIVVDATPAV